MKSILLIGLGRFGSHIAKELSEMNQQVMAVDTREDRVSAVLPYVTDGLIGDSTSRAFLETLGVSDFHVCIVAIGDEFQNSLETVWQLKELGARRIIARACQESQEKFLLRIGADEVVYPEKQLAAWTAIRCSSDLVLDYIDLGGDSSIFEITTPEDWWGRSVGGLEIRRRYSVNVLGIRTGGKLLMDITADTVFESGSSVLVLGRESVIRRRFRL